MLEGHGGVRWYSTAEGMIRVYFPEGKLACRHCYLCVKDPDYPLRQMCFLTREILPYPERCIGNNCPLQFEERETQQ